MKIKLYLDKQNRARANPRDIKDNKEQTKDKENPGNVLSKGDETYIDVSVTIMKQNLV